MQLFLVALALFLASASALMQDKWNVVVKTTGPKNGVALTALQPGNPVIVHPFIPPQPKAFNHTKGTPGSGCKAASDCAACIAKHYCLWTSSNTCVRSTKPSSRALVLQGKATNVCVKHDPVFKQHVVTQHMHRVTRAIEVKPLPTTVAAALSDPEALPPTTYAGVPLYVNNAAVIDVPRPAAPVFPVGFNAGHLIPAGAKVFTNNSTALAAPKPAPEKSKNVEFVGSAEAVKTATSGPIV